MVPNPQKELHMGFPVDSWKIFGFPGRGMFAQDVYIFAERPLESSREAGLSL